MSELTFDLKQGFLPPTDPLKSLPPKFHAWERIAANLPKLLVSNHLRKSVENLPDFHFAQLSTPFELERAMLLLSFIGHAYIWGGPNPATQIPFCLAKPWTEVAALLERPPVLSYASYALYNWFRIDEERALSLGNIALLQNFLGGMDEEWFVLVHVDIEAKASSAIQALTPAQVAAEEKNPKNLLTALKQIAQSLKELCVSLDRMPENCDPYIYYHRVRSYLHGWKNNPAIPSGMIYEKCYNNQPQFFRGETGAQSSIIPALDIILGITHEQNDLSIYLKEMRDYMPKAHRSFLHHLEKKGSIRAYVKELQLPFPDLRETYNKCIDLMVRFRFTHLKYAAVYIQKQTQDNPANSTQVGTGGTPFMDYLRKHEQEAELFKI